MFNYIANLYREGKLTANGVKNAITKGWITKDQAEMILEDNSLRGF